METKTTECIECTTGAMAGPIPGTLANGERCDTCEVYASDREAWLAIANAELLEVCRLAEVLIDGPMGDILSGDTMATMGAYDVLKNARAAIAKAERNAE